MNDKNIKIDYVSSFSTHKRGEEHSDIQDRLAIDIDKGRFALSDGVSQSALPHIWAQILVSEYLSIENTKDFPLMDFSMKYQNARDVFAATLPERDFFNLEMVEEEFGMSSATFAGLEISDGLLTWQVIGDTCLFILPDNGKLSCICSLPVEYNNDGKIDIKFNSHPSQLCSDGTKVGEWLCGELFVNSGWAFLMSDEMSSWFVNQYNLNANPIERLLCINNEEQFEDFVENEYRNKRLDSDDESIIIVHVCQIGTEIDSIGEINNSETEDNPSSAQVLDLQRKVIDILPDDTINPIVDIKNSSLENINSETFDDNGTLQCSINYDSLNGEMKKMDTTDRTNVDNKNCKNFDNQNLTYISMLDSFKLCLKNILYKLINKTDSRNGSCL